MIQMQTIIDLNYHHSQDTLNLNHIAFRWMNDHGSKMKWCKEMNALQRKQMNLIHCKENHFFSCFHFSCNFKGELKKIYNVCFLFVDGCNSKAVHRHLKWINEYEIVILCAKIPLNVRIEHSGTYIEG